MIVRNGRIAARRRAHAENDADSARRRAAGDEVSVQSLAEEWDALATRLGAAPYLRPGWTAAWWRAFGSGELRIRTLRKDGRLAGVVPFEFHRGVIRAATNYHAPAFGLLAENRDAETALARTLFAEAPRCVSMAPLGATGTSMEACRRAAESAGYRIVVRSFQRSPHLRIDGSWAEYESHLSASLTADIRRSQRRLERAGQVWMHTVDGREELDESLREAFAVEASGWKGARGTAIGSRRNVCEFYIDIARWASRRGLLRLFFLRLDCRPIAMYYALVDGGVCHLLKGGYDAAYRRFSPGKLLMRAVVRYCFAAGLARVEFHGDADPYKLHWANAVCEYARFDAFPGSLAGSVTWAALAYGRPAAKRALEWAGLKKPSYASGE